MLVERPNLVNAGHPEGIDEELNALRKPVLKISRPPLLRTKWGHLSSPKETPMPSKLDDEHIGPIRKALREGATVKSLADLYKVNMNTIYGFARRYGISIRHPIGSGKDARL